MKTQLNTQLDREAVSALMDGQLQEDEAAMALQMMSSQEARDCWALYHLVGDVLRSTDLAAVGRDTAFATRLSERLQQEVAPRPLEPVPPAMAVRDVTRAAANDGVFRWKMVAGLASFAAVAGIGWGMLGSLGPQPGAGGLWVQSAPTVSTQVAALAQLPSPKASAEASGAETEAEAGSGVVMLRDPRLDELLAAHRQTSGASALGDAAGFLRNATFEAAGR